MRVRRSVMVAAGTVFAALLAAAVFFSVNRALVSDTGFAALLEKADAEISAGNPSRALSLLKKGRRRAVSTGNWISLAKREIALSSPEQAQDTLSAALERFPANDRLSAVLVYVLLQEGNAAAAETWLPFLDGTEFAPLASWARLSAARPESCRDPEVYAAAWRFSGNPVFRRDAAVLYAAAGDYAQARLVLLAPAETGNTVPAESPDDALFRAYVAYDARYFSEVPDILGLSGPRPLTGGAAESGADEGPENMFPAQLPLEAALLAADAFYLDGKTEAADQIWRYFAASGGGDPLLFFNHALYASSWPEKRDTLEACLRRFPDYYPALAVYVRSAVPADSPDRFFPFYTENAAVPSLEEAGFVSAGMEEDFRNRPVTLPDARRALDAALDVQESPYAVPVRLENIRFLCFQSGKDAEARHLLWNILEESGRHTLPGDSPENALLEEFALWFFASQDDYAVFFTLAENASALPPVYEGIWKAAAGYPEEAQRCFASAAAVQEDAWAAAAGSAVLMRQAGDYTGAADYFTLAADLAGSAADKSRLFAAAAEAFAQQKAYTRAADMLRHAVSLDPDNYGAAAFLRRMEAEASAAVSPAG